MWLTKLLSINSVTRKQRSWYLGEPWEPWGDVVMFYDDFGAAGGLYELGRAVSGEELIESMSGTVEITAGTQDGQKAESGSGTE